MSLRIACDLDGTLADMNAALQREAERIFDERVDVSTRPLVTRRVVSEDTKQEKGETCVAGTKRPLTDRERSRLWNHVRQIDNFWETCPEIEAGAVARLATMTALAGWEILFLTQRPDTEGDTVQTQSQRWLRAHGFELPSVYVVSGSRGKIAASLSLDAVIDDRPDNCVDVAADSGAKPMLVWRGSLERLPPGVSRLPIQVVSSMAEAIEQLTRLHPRPTTPRGIFGRLRQALQLS